MSSVTEKRPVKSHHSSDEASTADVTAILDACAASLTMQEPFLCIDKEFSLYDSMSALEIMDLKMDCCEIPASAMALVPSDDDMIVPPRPLPTGLDDDVHPLPWEELSLNDAANICVQSLTRLESFLSGSSVAESTFTCLYAHNAVLADMTSRLASTADESLTAKFESMLCNHETEGSSSLVAQYALYVVILASVEISDLVRSIVVHADIYEEEDFNINTFDLKFFSEGEGKQSVHAIPQALGMLREVEGSDEERHALIIQRILQFQLEMLTACASLGILAPEKTRPVAESTKAAVASGVQQLEELRSLLETRKVTSCETDPILKRSFDSLIYRPLVGNTPIRTVSFHTPTESIDVLQKTLGEIGWAVCDVLLQGTSMGRIRRMLERVSASSVNILSRSLLLLNLYFEEKLLGQYDVTDLVAKHVQQVSGMPVSWMENQYARALMDRLVKPMYDALKLLLLNRNRQQAFLERVAFQGWVSLLQDATSVDVEVMGDDSTAPPFAFFSTYVRAQLARLMDHHVALSVELTLVRGHHDLAVAYWYRHYLLSAQISTLYSMKQAKAFTKPSEASVPKSRGKRKSAKCVEKKSDSGSAASCEDSLEDFELGLIILKRDLCKGITSFFASLSQAKLLQPPCYQFTSHELRFQQRFDAFSVISTPPPLTYQDFQQGSDFSSVRQSELLAATAEYFKSSKRTLEELQSQAHSLDMLPVSDEELRSLAKACVGNSVFVMKLTQLVRTEQEVSGSVSFDLETNKQFCTIKIL